MKLDVNIDVRHLTRIEGHGNIKIRIEGGQLREARWEVVETPRFFEALLQGKSWRAAALLTSRICGICSIGHSLASVRASEAAFGLEIPPAAAQLRLLAKHGETLQSHLLHLLFLAAPDFLGLPSAIPLLETKPEIFELAARLKNLANRLCDAVAGRTTHPVSIQVGGMARMPAAPQLAALREELRSSLYDLRTVVGLFRGFEIPDFFRETEFVSLQGQGAYPWIGGRLISSDAVDKAEHEYLAMTNEYVTPGSTSKMCKLSRKSFAVGALARFNNNHAALHPEALGIAHELGLRPTCHNPFMNNVAQLAECVHVTHESIALIDALLGVEGQLKLATEVTPRLGLGVGAVEVPRGILYHAYEYDEQGLLLRADCVIPTTQNNANIQHDIEALAAEYAGKGTTDEELEQLCSMLVRAYDPCVSCSVH